MSYVERDCIAILNHMAVHGYTDLHSIADATGVSYANVQRYLNTECWEKAPAISALRHTGSYRERQEAWLEHQRKVNPRMYWRYVPTLRPFRVEDGVIYKINRSRRDLLFYYASYHHFEIIPTSDYPGFRVMKVTEWPFAGTQLQPEHRELAYDTIASTR